MTSSSENFVPEAENMDMSSLHDKVFVVGVNSGAPDEGYMLVKTIHGPYNFYEMVGEVGRMWAEQQDNAKVYILEKDFSKRSRWLDAKTIEYIQSKYMDIIMEGVLSRNEDTPFTCEAGIVE